MMYLIPTVSNRGFPGWNRGFPSRALDSTPFQPASGFPDKTAKNGGLATSVSDEVDCKLEPEREGANQHGEN